MNTEGKSGATVRGEWFRGGRSAVAAVATVAMLVGGAASASAGTTWPTYHGNVARTGVDSGDNLSGLHRVWSNGLDGAAVYGQPVVADGRVFVATEDDNVYALDAHDGHVLWHRSIGRPLTDIGANAGCGDVDPLGITSTPVVDTAKGVVYVVGEVSTGGNAPAHHQMVGFNVFTGSVVRSANADPPLASATPAGETAVHLLQRAALALGNGRVYVGYGGNDGDCATYHGWVVGVGETGGANVSFEATPTSQGGAVWNAGDGPAIAGTGDVYVTTGNSNPFPGGSTDPGTYAESVVQLGPALGRPLHAFKDPVASGDADLATGGPTLIPGSTPEVFAVGKTDVGYLLTQSTLAKVGSVAGVCGSNPDGGRAYDAATGSVYVPCRGGGIQQVKLSPLRLGWDSGAVNGAPILVGGELWALQYNSGELQQLNPSTGAVLQTLQVGAVPTFASPSAALGLLLIGTDSGVAAYGGPAGVPAPAPPPPKSPAGSGYDIVTSGGSVVAAGVASRGEVNGALNAPVVGAAPDRASGGYWLGARDGGVFAFEAPFLGSMGGRHLNSPIVGMAATPTGRGYWMVASDGGIFAFGDARFAGSMGGRHLNSPIVGMAATPTGRGYWMVAADGGIFAFGDARFAGSMGGRHLNSPVAGMALAGAGAYWLVAADGGIFAFGGARFAGSMGGRHLNSPVVGMAAPDDSGYWMVAADGGVFSFGSASFAGSAVGQPTVGAAVAIIPAS